jgi:hypothetical protein
VSTEPHGERGAPVTRPWAPGDPLTVLDWAGTLGALHGLLGVKVGVEVVGSMAGAVATLVGYVAGDGADPAAPSEEVMLALRAEQDSASVFGWVTVDPGVFRGAVQTGPVLQITLADVIVKIAPATAPDEEEAPDVD